METKKFGFSGSSLKLIAIITMMIDHVTVVGVGFGIIPHLFPGSQEFERWYQIYVWGRTVGRIACPIFFFLLVEGFLHTKSWKKYAARLAAFALLSEVPFDLAFQGGILAWSGQNIFFTLLIGLLMMETMKRLEGRRFLILAAVAGFAALADLLRTDYGAEGIISIALLYWYRYNRKLQCTITGLIESISLILTPMWLLAAGKAAAFVMIYLYNGERGKLRLKYFFYLFYPVHLLVIWGVYWFRMH